ncbi:hypothetical protein NLC82_03500 [Candidatus Aminicenantes bacterium AC-335-A11]|jgi:hypothetical protein|nr:hypothetical protein [SCandidatus Aminicenantes bacterium Aminicenantia_JdfR_composite]MCP2597783.1 hypothetical protein [Candidatus Aminicenantes bacterium AC-335-L06]MCP2618464.1 hypothetical protein [Candidatus Aminicenantes bacterium AC-335-A11]MCP2620508.1 hypothetical protein [Candidatus Aminicenantes bacterium AC-334-E05]
MRNIPVKRRKRNDIIKLIAIQVIMITPPKPGASIGALYEYAIIPMVINEPMKNPVTGETINITIMLFQSALHLKAYRTPKIMANTNPAQIAK